jgi:hypothetical protein
MTDVAAMIGRFGPAFAFNGHDCFQSIFRQLTDVGGCGDYVYHAAQFSSALLCAK